MKDDSLADVSENRSKVTCPSTGLNFYISDYTNPVREYNIDVGLWPDGTRYETSIGLWPMAVKFWYRIRVKMKDWQYE